MMFLNTKWISLALSLLGVGGVGLTSWLSVKCSKKAEEKDTTKDKAIAYTPAVISGIVTSVCIIGSHGVNRKEITALTAGLTYAAANKEKILKKVRKELGTGAEKKMLAESAIETSSENKKNTTVIIEDTGYGKTHFVEDFLGREFYCSIEQVEWAEKMLNHMFSKGERVNYNTFYELLGLKKSRAGWEFGWPSGEDLYGYNLKTDVSYSMDSPIYFENIPVEGEDGERCYVISARVTPPVNGYLEMEG